MKHWQDGKWGKKMQLLLREEAEEEEEDGSVLVSSSPRWLAPVNEALN